MRHAVPAALALLVGGAPAVALAQAAGTAPDPSKDAATAVITELGTGKTTIVYDRALSEEFEVNRAIVERVD